MQSTAVFLIVKFSYFSYSPINLRRHIVCEKCDPKLNGGYDEINNQLVICENTVHNKNHVESILTHELIHMFDYCKHKLDFKNIDHLACTEIRAANLTHCSFFDAWQQGDASLIKIKERHQNCVKTKALSSIMAVQTVSREEAINAIERVFPQCYTDLEPIGRRIKKNSKDMERAFYEGKSIYSYDIN